MRGMILGRIVSPDANEFIENELKLKFPGEYRVNIVHTCSAETNEYINEYTYDVQLVFDSKEEEIMWMLKWT